MGVQKRFEPDVPELLPVYADVPDGHGVLQRMQPVRLPFLYLQIVLINRFLYPFVFPNLFNMYFQTDLPIILLTMRSDIYVGLSGSMGDLRSLRCRPSVKRYRRP